MPATYYQDLLEKISTRKFRIPLMERKALGWYKDMFTELREWQSEHFGHSLTKIQNRMTYRQAVPSTHVEIGHLYFFNYHAKFDEKIYDALPYTLFLWKDARYLFGVNFHYLEYSMRAKLFDAMYVSREIRNLDERNAYFQSLSVTYERLSQHRQYNGAKACFHKYLRSHIRGRMLHVGEPEWKIGLFLPSEQFQNATKYDVYIQTNPAFRKLRW